MNMVRKCVKHFSIIEAEAFRKARCRTKQTAVADNLNQARSLFDQIVS